MNIVFQKCAKDFKNIMFPFLRENFICGIITSSPRGEVHFGKITTAQDMFRRVRRLLELRSEAIQMVCE